jgi:neurotransmitter:Na+ symporter, NSS family
MTKPREHWSSKVGFLFAAIGSAVGLGVLWMFPYTVGSNGGGLFLLTYILCVILIGIPTLIAELSIGRAAQGAAIATFEKLGGGNRFFKLAGYLSVIASFFIMAFYSVIAGWGMSYVVMCLNAFYKNKSALEVADAFKTLASSGGISTVWHLLFTLLTMGIVFSGVRKGIENWSRLMTRALFIILIILVLYNVQLVGFGKALAFIFYADPSNFSLSSVLEALGLAFFTLSLGQGIMISYGSYLKDEDNIPQMACVIAFSVIVIAILAALMVFPAVFTFGFKPNAGEGLVFEALPYLFSQLPGSLILSTIFFILFVFTALTSSMAFVEVVASNCMEHFNWKRKKAVALTCLATFILGLPCATARSGTIFYDWQAIYGHNFLTTLSNLVSTWIIPLAGLLTALFVGYVFDKKQGFDAFVQGSNYRALWPLYRFFMRYIIPIFIIFVILQKSGLLVF